MLRTYVEHDLADVLVRSALVLEDGDAPDDLVAARREPVQPVSEPRPRAQARDQTVAGHGRILGDGLRVDSVCQRGDAVDQTVVRVVQVDLLEGVPGRDGGVDGHGAADASTADGARLLTGQHPAMLVR